MCHHRPSQKRSDEIARDQSLETDIDTAAHGNAPVQDHAIEEIEVAVTVEIEVAIEVEIVVATGIEVDDRALIVIVEEIVHPPGIADEIEVDDRGAEAEVDQEIDLQEEEYHQVNQEVDLVVDQGLLESDLKIPIKRPKKMDEVVLKLLIKKPVIRIVQTPQGPRSIKNPKNRRRRKKKRKRKNIGVTVLDLNRSSANASPGQSPNQSLSTNLFMKNLKSVQNRMKMDSRPLMPAQFEISVNDPRKMTRRMTTSSISGKVLALRSQMTQKKQSEKKKLQRRMMQARMPLQTLSAQGINRQSRSSLTHANGNLSIRTKKIMNHLRPKLRMTSRTR